MSLASANRRKLLWLLLAAMCIAGFAWFWGTRASYVFHLGPYVSVVTAADGLAVCLAPENLKYRQSDWFHAIPASPITGWWGHLNLKIPYWLVVAFLGVCVFVLWRQSRKFAEGHCANCGYDLQGTRGRPCPECGGKATAPPDQFQTRAFLAIAGARFAGLLSLFWLLGSTIVSDGHEVCPRCLQYQSVKFAHLFGTVLFRYDVTLHASGLSQYLAIPGATACRHEWKYAHRSKEVWHTPYGIWSGLRHPPPALDLLHLVRSPEITREGLQQLEAREFGNLRSLVNHHADAEKLIADSQFREFSRALRQALLNPTARSPHRSPSTARLRELSDELWYLTDATPEPPDATDE